MVLMSTTTAARPSALGYALFTEQHCFHVGRVGHNGEDDVGMGRYLGGRGAAGGPGCGQLLQGFGTARERPQLMPALDQVDGHRTAHDAWANETDIDRHGASLIEFQN